STVTLNLDGDEVTYTIVGAVEAQPRQGRISNESPVGKALIGHRSGDDFEIATPSASLRAVIKDVRAA
ncbi:MAG: GreA/GreB family elongation factor, partial [Chloroflexota bacterium]|nr:GreA/GreB family elongation factor [Chloroflexota bacterium]